MKRSSVLTATLALVGFALTLTTALPAHAAGCTDATIAGVYGLSQSDSNGGNVGYIAFDGRGRWAASWTNAGTGGVNTVTDSGTYQVNPNCSGSGVNDAANFHVNFVIVSGSQEITAITTDPGGAGLVLTYKKRDIAAAQNHQ